MNTTSMPNSISDLKAELNRRDPSASREPRVNCDASGGRYAASALNMKTPDEQLDHAL